MQFERLITDVQKGSKHLCDTAWPSSNSQVRLNEANCPWPGLPGDGFLSSRSAVETLLRYLEGSHGQIRLPLAFLSFHLVEQLDSSYRPTWTLHWPKLAESKFPNNLANVAFRPFLPLSRRLPRFPPSFLSFTRALRSV